MTGRQKAMAFFITLGSCLVALAITLNVSWILIHWRRALPLVLGIIVFALIIAGITVYTVFLVRELRRSEQQDSFLNAVTHELKTPIASIRLYLDTLQSRDVSDDKRKEFYRIMLADTDRLQYTVEQVLKAGVTGQKGKQGERVMLDVAPMVEECVELARTRHHLDGAALAFEPGMSAAVLADPDDLRTAVTNLLDNAVKYSTQGMHVRVAVAPNGDRVQVRVADQGVGIPRSDLKKVFQRFYRVPGRERRQVKGTGLGLYIVQTIAKKHGGRVFAESEGEGRGSTFTLELPKAAGS